MRIAVIDCGTNTFNLLVADASHDAWSVVFQNKLPVKLGAGGFEDHFITPSRFVRGLDALCSHHYTLANYDCERVFAFATSAVRESKNGKDFIQKAKQLFSIDIEVIDGNREAELIYEGVRQTMELGDKPSLIMDIGGGSTEFIIADSTGILWKRSFLLGVSRLHDILKPEDKMTSENVSALKKLLQHELLPLKDALAQFDARWLIGSSGSFDTLLSLYFDKSKRSLSEILLSNEIALSAFPDIHSWLMGSTFEQRLKHPVIPSIRAEYMPLASYLVKYVLGMKTFEKLYHSAYSLKEGAMLDILKRIDWTVEGARRNVGLDDPESGSGS